MRLSMNKQDICEPIEIPREKFKEMLGEVIKATIIGEEHLGDNLKKQCVDYIDKLNLYKDVIEEVSKKLKSERKIALSLNQPYTISVIDSTLQILDKVKGVMNNEYIHRKK